MYEERGEIPSSRIIFHAVNTVQARAEYAEGDVYEVEYFLQVRQEESRTGEPTPKMVLLRRLWPNPAQQNEPGMAGGVARRDDEFSIVDHGESGGEAATERGVAET